MKIRLLLIVGIGFAPLALVGQTAFLYNKGVMSVKSTDATQTTLYINGNFIAGHDNATVCDITLSNSQTVLTGDFIHDLNGGTSPANSTTFKFGVGDASRFVFRGSAAQSIKLASGLTYGRDYLQSKKGANNINFPTLVIQNSKHVTLVPELAAQAQNLAFETGRLILESRRANSDDFTGITSGSHNPASSTMLAHFMVSGNITNKNTALAPTAANNDVFGAVQVNLELDKASDYTSGVIDERYGRSLVGMGSPYAQMKSDYFFWNFLMIPKDNSLIGGTPGNSMTDPQRTLKAGEGFVIGLDLRGVSASNYEYDLHPLYQIPVGRPKFTDRVTEKYQFSRFGPFFNSANNVNQARFAGHTVANPVLSPGGGTITDPAYAQEILNHTDIGNLPITKGYNYYANPYTVPLDLSPILDAASAGTILPEWNNIKVGSSTVTDRDFTNTVWVLGAESRGSGSYDILNPSGIGPGNKWIMVSAKYRLMKSEGSTTNAYDAGTGGSAKILAPLQMFVLYSPKGSSKTLKIPASARSIESNALFLRSTSASDDLKDDFLFEINDVKTKSSDRVAIVIRTPQEVMTDSRYGGVKKIMTVISSDQTTTRSTTEEGTITQTNMSTMYTKGDGGAALESNVLGVPMSAKTESTVLYVSPSFTAQNITISADRLETANRVKGIKLIDKVSNKEFDLFAGKPYTTTSKPTDPEDRFTLRFIFDESGTSGIEDGNSESKSITSYYSNGTLTVAGFDDADLGSTISVYDIQGRMAAQAKVDDTTVKIAQPFSPGAYIVKVVGNTSYAAKFLVR